MEVTNILKRYIDRKDRESERKKERERESYKTASVFISV